MQRRGASEWALSALLAMAIGVGGCDSPPPEVDAGPGDDAGIDIDSSTEGCADDLECSDGLFCNGAERCLPEDADADARGCVAASAPACADGQACDESLGECEADPCVLDGDADGDGERSTECGGADCDDTDPNRYSSAVEFCDAMHRDEDCNPETFGFRDADGDGSPDLNCCNMRADGTLNCGDDCNDSRPNVNLSASEVCDGFDNDCDDLTDEGVVQSFFVDGDSDTYGDESMATEQACFAPVGYAEMGRDCDDADPDRNPARPELCDVDGVDENCDGVANPESLCACSGDISRACALPGACAAGTERCVGGSWGACSIGATAEVCNMIDDDCDGESDEGLFVVCYPDEDDDGYPGDANPAPQRLCPQAGRLDAGGCPLFFTDRVPFGGDIDCNDSSAAQSPGLTEVCDAAFLDEDCDGMANPNPPCECSGSGTQACPMPGVCAAGTQTCVDGAWTDCTIAASAETCNGDDDDCDGTTDEDPDSGPVCAGDASFPQCVEGACAVVACEDGRGDCDGDPSNGCEVDFDADPSSCGRCGAACMAGAECDSGVCTAPVAIGAGYRFTCALHSGGTVSCWGEGALARLGDGGGGTSPNPVAVQGVSTATAIAIGAAHSCALLADGTLMCWGDNSNGQTGQPVGSGSISVPMPVPGLTGVLEVQAHYAHTCARTASEVRCWGLNSDGQLGDGGTTDSATPVLVPGLETATQLALGPAHSCARLADGTARCWGLNDRGQLGDGTTMDRSSPVEVLGWAGVESLGCGGQTSGFTCAAFADGTVQCLGDNGEGQLGDGSTASTNGGPPVTMMGVTDAASVVDYGGANYGCFLRDSGAVACVGENRSGELGRGSTSNQESTVADVIGLDDAVQVVTGFDHVCVLRETGAIACWGSNALGQFGDGSAADSAEPTAGAPWHRMVSVDTFRNGTCAVRNDGGVYCWGSSGSGALGDGGVTTGTALAPVRVTGIDDAVQVDNGNGFSCAARSSGEVACWGYGRDGQLGNGASVDSDVPVAVLGLTDARQIQVGYRHACALRRTGEVVCWGDAQTSSEQPVAIAGLSDVAAISAGTANVCARDTNGEVRCWRNGSPALVSGIRDAVSISTRYAHSCATRANGEVRCWGDNESGQLGDGSTDDSSTPVVVSGLSDATSVDGAHASSCAIRSGGTVVCWGDNVQGQIGDGSNTQRRTPVAVSGLSGVFALGGGNESMCALLDDGAVYCWGNNDDGELGDGTPTDRTTPVRVVELP